MIQSFSIKTSRQGLHEITDKVASVVAKSQISDGICVVFLKHTSASLIIQENADPSAKRDLEAWMNRLVEENDSLYTHTTEGPDDMPSHIKSVLTASSLSIPVQGGALSLGIWQGIYLWEHRKHSHNREIVVYIGS